MDSRTSSRARNRPAEWSKSRLFPSAERGEEGGAIAAGQGQRVPPGQARGHLDPSLLQGQGLLEPSGVAQHEGLLLQHARDAGRPRRAVVDLLRLREMGQGLVPLLRPPREQRLRLEHARPREGRGRLARGLAQLSVGATGRPRVPQAVAPHDAQPGREVLLVRLPAQGARGHRDRFAVPEQAEQGVRLRQGQRGRLLRGPEPPRPAESDQRVGMAPLVQRGARPRALRLAPPAQDRPLRRGGRLRHPPSSRVDVAVTVRHRL